MPHLRSLAVASLIVGLAGCATTDLNYAAGPEELSGRTLLIEDEAGQTELVTLQPDGTVILREQPGDTVRAGRWGFRGGSEPMRPEDELAGIPAAPASQGMAPYEWLCVDFPPPGEQCWRYQAPLAENQPVEVVSASGEELTITLVAR